MRYRSLMIVLAATLGAVADGQSVAYTVAGKPYEGYYTSPSPRAPLVLLIHDWDGLTGYEKKRAAMLKREGYAVFAADMFGKGVRPEKIAERKRLTGALYRNRAKMRDLLKGALEAAEDQGGNVSNAVAMGYCFGGTVVLELARTGTDLTGFVSFHGGLDIPEGQDYARTTGRVLVFHGTADKNITMDDFAHLAQELEHSEVDHEMITYGGAPHAFTVFGSERYRKDADEESWHRLIRFLDSVFE